MSVQQGQPIAGGTAGAARRSRSRPRDAGGPFAQGQGFGASRWGCTNHGVGGEGRSVSHAIQIRAGNWQRCNGRSWLRQPTATRLITRLAARVHPGHSFHRQGHESGRAGAARAAFRWPGPDPARFLPFPRSALGTGGFGIAEPGPARALESAEAVRCSRPLGEHQSAPTLRKGLAITFSCAVTGWRGLTRRTQPSQQGQKNQVKPRLRCWAKINGIQIIYAGFNPSHRERSNSGVNPIHDSYCWIRTFSRIDPSPRSSP